jgi:hypothetical protein
VTESRFFPELIPTLFNQLHAFGVVGYYTHPSKENLEWMLHKKIATLRLLFQILSELGEDYSLMPPEPFIYNTNNWSKRAPPAGYYEPNIDLRPIEYLDSLFLCWYLQTTERPEAATAKLLRATLWIIREHGFLAGLRYLLDLADAGYILGSAVIAPAFSVLCMARRRVSYDDDVVGLLVEDPSARDWTRAKLRAWDFETTPIRDVNDDLTFLLDSCYSAEARARAALNADDWVIALGRLGIRVEVMQRVFRSLGVENDLEYATHDSRFEEIRADCGGHFMTYRIQDAVMEGDRVQELWAGYSAMVALSFHHDSEWFDRQLEERVLLPDVLMPLTGEARIISQSRMPEEWRRCSDGIRVILARLVFADESYPMRCVAQAKTRLLAPGRIEIALAPGSSEITTDLLNTVQRIFETIFSGGSESRYSRVSAELEKLAGNSVAGVETILAPGENLIDGYDESVLLMSADISVECAKYLSHQFSVSEKQLEPMFDAIFLNLCKADLDETLTEGTDLKNKRGEGEAANFYQHAIKCYPAFFALHWERAICLDVLGDPEAAWGEIQNALVLENSLSHVWHSAGVILQNLDQRRYALVAGAAAAAIASKE